MKTQSDQERVEERRDEVIKRMLATPPQPKRKNRAAASGRPSGDAGEGEPPRT